MEGIKVMRIKRRANLARPSVRSREAGMTLIETSLALFVLMTASAGLMGLAAMAVITTENQGHLAARTTEYAQDKMEQLISLRYGNNTTDTADADCITFGDCPNTDPDVNPTGLAEGGAIDFAAPVDYYVDYLDVNGNPLGGGTAPPANWYYMRVWEVVDAPGGVTNLKQVTVACRTRFIVGAVNEGRIPETVISTYKTWPF
ncbi:MAG: hypothetical protein A3F68_09475 [Acidobacteria bacterium RIFCSPLOWO2_12_FULL_54_10]|nr:MAG: hypothetical protein A3F68_09475 [Acidobacteria bacterium RIFCSPLOWO2_12_FULL_54_10]